MNNFQEYKYKFSTLSVLEVVKENEMIENIIEEINKLKQELQKYNILIKDLSFDETTYDERNKALNIAYSIIENEDLFKFFNDNNKFIVNKVAKHLPVERKTLEELKDYIVLYFIILSDPNFSFIQNYLNIVEAINVLAIDEIREIKSEDNMSKGIVVHRGLINDVILTSKGEVLKIKKNKEVRIGEESIGVEFLNLRKYKLHISILAIVVILVAGITIYKNNNIKNIIIVETTSTITIELNDKNNLVNVYSKTDKGKELINKLNLRGIHIDDSLVKILDYAVENGMSPDSGFIVKVTGSPLGYNDLIKVEEYIKEESLQVKFNNSGDENKVSE